MYILYTYLNVCAYNGKTSCTFTTMCNDKFAIIVVVLVVVKDLPDAVNKSLIKRNYISVKLKQIEFKW